VTGHAAAMAAGKRFGFGANWARFLQHLDSGRILDAERSLQRMLAVSSLAGHRFLDAGSGSGHFSLAAFRLGADGHSFDFATPVARFTTQAPCGTQLKT
jgi:hypothetical protein